MSEVGSRFMEFRIADQLFAVPLMSVREVLQKPEVTQVPNMPAHFEGMMNLRGKILGIFNIRKKLIATAAKASQSPHQVVIVIEEDGNSVGIIVDEVTRVLHPTTEQMSPAPLRANDPANVYVSGVIKVDSSLVVILKMAELIGVNQMQKKLAAA